MKHTIENCDDGNVINGDGCNSDCIIEPYYQCGYSLFSANPFTSQCDGICGDGEIIARLEPIRYDHLQ